MEAPNLKRTNKQEAIDSAVCNVKVRDMLRTSKVVSKLLKRDKEGKKGTNDC